MIYNWKRKLGRKNTKHELIDTDFEKKKTKNFIITAVNGECGMEKLVKCSAARAVVNEPTSTTR